MSKKDDKKTLSEKELDKIVGGLTSNKAAYKCEICNATFSSQFQLKVHRNQKHSTAI